MYVCIWGYSQMNLAHECGKGWEVSQKIGTALFFSFKVNFYNIYV